MLSLAPFIGLSILAKEASASDDLKLPERYFMCIFGPDSSGAYVEEIVPERLAKNCDMFCVCQGLKTSCLLGPDSSCNFATETVSREFADTCDRETCSCTSHTDYQTVANQRLSDANQCQNQLVANGGNSIFNQGSKDSDTSIFNIGSDTSESGGTSSGSSNSNTQAIDSESVSTENGNQPRSMTTTINGVAITDAN